MKLFVPVIVFRLCICLLVHELTFVSNMEVNFDLQSCGKMLDKILKLTFALAYVHAGNYQK